MILVINNNKTTYSEKYMLFYDANDAITYANSLGFSKYSFIGLSEKHLKPGVLHHVNAGSDCDLEVIKINPALNELKNLDNFGYGGC